jgi:spore germination protein GerM
MKIRVITFIVVVLAALIGFKFYSDSVKKQIFSPSPTISKPETESKEEPSQTEEASKSVKIYRVGIEHDEEVLRAIEVKVSAKHPIESAIEKLIKHDKSSRLANPMPDGTRLIGLNLKNGTVTVNLSSEFTDNFHGGSEAETLIMESILRTLSQFPNVKKVRLLVEGKSIDTLGHLDLSGPLDVHSTGSESGEQD